MPHKTEIIFLNCCLFVGRHDFLVMPANNTCCPFVDSIPPACPGSSFLTDRPIDPLSTCYLRGTSLADDGQMAFHFVGVEYSRTGRSQAFLPKLMKEPR